VGGTMNEWLKNVLGKVRDLWSKWKPIQKVILIGIIAVVIVAIIAVANLSSKPTSVRLFNAAVTDQASLSKILDRISEENIQVSTSSDGIITVDNENTARKLRGILISENLVPSSIDPWASYYDRGWSTTDAEQNQKKKNIIQKQLQMHIETLDGIQMADVTLVLPDDKLFTADQNPVSGSVIIRTNPSSDFLQNRTKIKGLQDIVISAVEGLKAENLIISDSEGNQINDFAGMAESDRVDIISKQRMLIQKQEVQIRAKILKAFQKTYTEDRCRDMVVTVEMDMSEKKSDYTIYSPIVIKKDNPDTPYDDSEYRDTLPISQQTVTKEWQGTGYNPEGPSGVEGQTPPVYSDMSNVIGKSTETGVTQNNVINTTQTTENVSPKIDKVSVSVNLDGKWTKIKDPKTGNPVVADDGSLSRQYTPLTPEEISEAEKSIRGAIAYDRNRGDTVVVTNIAYDRDAEFEAEDKAYFAAIQRRNTIILIFIVIAVILVSFILFRMISKAIDKRRREREKRLLEERQRAAQQRLWDAQEDGMQVTMSVEETRRMELLENAVNMAKEHPEDVAMLIRTWLMEE
jgi:flagellar M-ring protein FliF